MSVAAAYPIILIDEFQDCDNDLLRIAQQLSESSTVLVGADDFQDLNSSGDSPSVKWLRSTDCELQELSGSQRTENQQILTSAISIREASVAPSAIEVIPRADKHGGLIAFEIAKRIVWGNLKKNASRVLITPAGPDSSTWVKGVMKSLGKSLANGKLPPVPFRWEDSGQDKCDKAHGVATDFLEVDGGCPKHALQQLAEYKDPILRMAGGRALRLISLRGKPSIAGEELQQIIELSAHAIGGIRHGKQVHTPCNDHSWSEEPRVRLCLHPLAVPSTERSHQEKKTSLQRNHTSTAWGVSFRPR